MIFRNDNLFPNRGDFERCPEQPLPAESLPDEPCQTRIVLQQREDPALTINPLDNILKFMSSEKRTRILLLQTDKETLQINQNNLNAQLMQKLLLPDTAQDSRSRASQKKDSQYAIRNNLILLKSVLLRLKRELEYKLYILELNVSKLRQHIYEAEIIQFFKENPISKQGTMSIFTDDKDQPIPNTPEGLEKASDRILLPIYRKKYDWNLQAWRPRDKKKLWQLTASRLEIDTVKLILEEKFIKNQVETKDLISELHNIRNTLDFRQGKQDEISVMKNRLVMHREALKKKLDLLVKQRDSAEEPVQLIEIKMPSAALLSHFDDNKLKRHLTREYWKCFWDSISSLISCRVEWTGRDCQMQWDHHLSPEVNLQPFTKEDDQKLLTLARNSTDWDQIAEELDCSRTAYQCFERYQRALNPALTKGEWSPDEDAELVVAIKEVGEELLGPSRWSRISLRLSRRSNFQCRARFLHSLKSNLKHGGWNMDEDILLLSLVEVYGRARWPRISQHIPWRTDMKCRERFESVLKPRLEKSHPWSWQTLQGFIKAVPRFHFDDCLIFRLRENELFESCSQDIENGGSLFTTSSPKPSLSRSKKQLSNSKNDYSSLKEGRGNKSASSRTKVRPRNAPFGSKPEDKSSTQCKKRKKDRKPTHKIVMRKHRRGPLLAE